MDIPFPIYVHLIKLTYACTLIVDVEMKVWFQNCSKIDVAPQI